MHVLSTASFSYGLTSTQQESRLHLRQSLKQTPQCFLSVPSCAPPSASLPEPQPVCQSATLRPSTTSRVPRTMLLTKSVQLSSSTLLNLLVCQALSAGFNCGLITAIDMLTSSRPLAEALTLVRTRKPPYHLQSHNTRTPYVQKGPIAANFYKCRNSLPRNRNSQCLHSLERTLGA